MFKSRIVFNAVFAFVSLMSFAAVSLAQSQAFVSAKTGNDANPCTVAAPCRTFNQALNAIAPGGEVVAVDSGDYQPFVVTKSATVGAAAGVHAGVNGTISVSIAAADKVTLRGLSVNGVGAFATGIAFGTVGTLYVENCVVENFVNSGIVATHNTSLGIQQTFVKNTVARGNSDIGLLVELFSGARGGVSKIAVENCRFEDNDRGLVIGQHSRGTVSNSSATYNTRAGFQAVVNGTLNLENCVSTHNGEGLSSVSTAIVRASNCTVTDNEIGLSIQGGSLLSRRNNTVEGNTNNGAFSGVFSAK